MTITTIPTRTVGSLGPTKLNRRAVSDPFYQLDAGEENLLRDCAIHAVTQLGTETSPAWDSIQGILSGDTLYYMDPLSGVPAGVLLHPWAPSFGGGDWHYGTNPAGMFCSVGTLDAIDQTTLNLGPLHRTQTPRLRFRMGVDGTPGTGAWVYLNDAGFAGTAVGIEFLGAANEINAFIYTGGAKTTTHNLGAWAGGTEYLFDLRVGSTGSVTVSFNGVEHADIGTVAATNMILVMQTSADGGAGDFAYVRMLQLMADWSA